MVPILQLLEKHVQTLRKSFGMDQNPKLHEIQHLEHNTDIMRTTLLIISFTSVTLILTRRACIVIARIETNLATSGMVSFLQLFLYWIKFSISPEYTDIVHFNGD